MQFFPSQFPISRSLALYSVTLVMILLGIMSANIFLLVGTAIKDVHGRMAQQASANISNSISDFLSFQKEALKELAQSPIIGMAIIEPNQVYRQLRRVMQQTTLLGTNGQLTLLDYNGSILNESTAQPTFDYTGKSWVAQLIGGSIDHHWEISSASNGSRYWCIAVPVFVNEQRHGVLVANIALSAPNIFQRQNIASHQMEIEILQYGQNIATFGPQINGPAYSQAIGNQDLTIICRMDNSELNQGLMTLFVRIGLTLLGIVLMFLGAWLYFTNRLYVKPLKNLARMASKISSGINHQILPTDQRLLEIATLAEKYNLLIGQIRHREEVLLATVAKLEKRTTDCKNIYKSREVQRIRNDNLEAQLAARTLELKAARVSLIVREKVASVGRLTTGLSHELNWSLNFVRTKIATLKEDFNDLLLIHSKYKDLTLKASENPLLAERAAEVQVMGKKLDVEYLLENIPVLFNESARGFARIAKIIQCMGDFSQSGLDDHFCWANINTGIEDALILARNEYRYYAEVHTEFGTVSDIRCSLQQLQQVFLNLIVNSTDAIASQNRKNKGVISIRTWQDGNTVLCEIRDDGPGIASEHRCRIFKPFYTTKVTTKRIGLGLPISYDIIVHKHRGKLSLHCPGEGGAIFTIALPVDQKKEIPYGSR